MNSSICSCFAAALQARSAARPRLAVRTVPAAQIQVAQENIISPLWDEYMTEHICAEEEACSTAVQSAPAEEQHLTQVRASEMEKADFASSRLVLTVHSVHAHVHHWCRPAARPMDHLC